MTRESTKKKAPVLVGEVSSGIDVPKDTSKSIDKKLEEKKTKVQLGDLQKIVKDTLTDKERETLNPTGIKKFFDGIFGKNTVVSNLFGGIATWIANKIGLGTKTLSDRDVFGEIKSLEKKLKIESAVVSHRANTDAGGKPNTKEAFKKAIEIGEKEIEVDIRLIAGKLYLRHDAPEPGKEGTYTALEEILPLLKKNPSVTLFADIKGGKAEVEQLAKILKQEKYQLQDRVVILGFNPAVMKAAAKHLKGAPRIFSYFPTGSYKALEKTVMPMLKNNHISKDTIIHIFKQSDAVGITPNAAKNLNEANIYYDREDIFGHDDEHAFHTYSLLPPKAMLDNIRESNGYLSVPWGLVRDFPEFFKAAKEAGVKVAVFGFTNPDDHEEKRAIAMGANVIITDRPQFV